MASAQRGGGPSPAGWQDPHLEAGEIPHGAIDRRTDLPAPPDLLFQNDGSFMAAFMAASAQPAAGDAQACEAGTGGAQGAPAAANQGAACKASGGAPPAGEAKKKGPLLLKPKSSIVKVRSRKGELLEPRKREKKEEDDSSKPFYLRELERYRASACDDKTGDRPLVK